MKTHIIRISTHFMEGHPRAGKPTYFVDKFFKGQGIHTAYLADEWGEWLPDLHSKIHTMRCNYDYWAHRIKEVQEGKAVLRVQYWPGKAFRCKPMTICDLTAENHIGCQKVTFDRDQINSMRIDGVVAPDLRVIASNDGLCFDDFRDWFKEADFTNPMALIHFTGFRY